MLSDSLSWGWQRLRPSEGWLPLILLLTIILTASSAVIAVDWVPESAVVFWAAMLGLLLGSVLAKSRLKWFAAWAIILAYGLVVIAIFLGRLIPPLPTTLQGWAAFSVHIRQNAGLLLDRIGGWIEAVSGGGSSQETVVFAMALGLLAWLVAAYVGWSTFRQKRPIAGLMAMGFALGANGYFGDAPLWPVALFVGLATLLAASVHFANIERGWIRRAVDYSTEIRLDLLSYSAGLALILLAIAAVLPAVNFRALTNAVLNHPEVNEAEEAFQRAFAGVRQPRREGTVIDLEGNPGRTGTLPRSFLLGAPPELYETVVMTTTTGGANLSGGHWRGTSYDIYTGRGWSISAERQELIQAGQEIPLPPIQAKRTVTQSVYWVQEPLNTRFTFGLPERFDQEVTTFWRGVEDLSRVRAADRDYQAVSRVSGASAAVLRQANLAGVPQAIMGRYTMLPDTIPERVYQLSSRVGGDPAFTPFDRARALERFLRQYPYSLDVALPPPGEDPVDYFLFDLQSGYCDYYASAMVVMARALGLPARLAAGFAAQATDENGVQTIYQINAHSWAEIYFAGYGWIEFEPTASFPTRELGPLTPVSPEFGREEPLAITYPPPIPAREGRESSSAWWIAAIIVVVMALFMAWRWQRGQTAPTDGVRWAYARLLRSARRLGLETPASQTPVEFEAALLERLGSPPPSSWRFRLGEAIQPDISRLSEQYIERQYGGRGPAGSQARDSWQRIRSRMWLLGTFRRLLR